MEACSQDTQKDLFPEGKEIFQWIKGLCQFPHRRTGSKEGRLAADYVKRQFEEIGLEQVTIESVPSAVFEASDCSLMVRNIDIPCFMLNGTLHPEEFGEFEAGPLCQDTEIVYLGEGREADFQDVNVQGKIVLCDCPWFEMDEDAYRINWCETEGILYDPDHEKRTKLKKYDSYSPNSWPYNYIMAQKKGAAGFVGVLNNYFRDGINWSEDYSEIAQSQGCESFSIPGLWIGTDAFQKLKPLLNDGWAPASMRMKTVYKKGFAQNVSGTLPGLTDEIILVHSHHDAVFTGAVQDASGMSEVLALAKYFAKLPIERRGKTLVFAGFDGHYTDYAGHKDFIASRLERGDNIILDCVIEHIGKEVGLGADNSPVARDMPEIRLIYTTDVADRVRMVSDAVKRNDIKRSVILPVSPYVDKGGTYEFQQDEVISDAYYSHINGIPVISMLSPQMYLFHPMDTPEMVPQEELRPIGIMFAELIHKTL